KENAGDKPPPNEMAMRMLDAGQSSECKPRNISVDQWAGTYDGEKRKKLEIAIEPILKQLDELLAQAQTKSDSLKKAATSGDGLQSTHAEPLSGAKQHIAEAQ